MLSIPVENFQGTFSFSHSFSNTQTYEFLFQYNSTYVTIDGERKAAVAPILFNSAAQTLTMEDIIEFEGEVIGNIIVTANEDDVTFSVEVNDDQVELASFRFSDDRLYTGAVYVVEKERFVLTKNGGGLILDTYGRLFLKNKDNQRTLGVHSPSPPLETPVVAVLKLENVGTSRHLYIEDDQGNIIQEYQFHSNVDNWPIYGRSFDYLELSVEKNSLKLYAYAQNLRDTVLGKTNQYTVSFDHNSVLVPTYAKFENTISVNRMHVDDYVDLAGKQVIKRQKLEDGSSKAVFALDEINASDLFATNASATELSATNASVTELSATNASATNVKAQSYKVGDIEVVDSNRAAAFANVDASSYKVQGIEVINDQRSGSFAALNANSLAFPNMGDVEATINSKASQSDLNSLEATVTTNSLSTATRFTVVESDINTLETSKADINGNINENFTGNVVSGSTLQYATGNVFAPWTNVKTQIDTVNAVLATKAPLSHTHAMSDVLYLSDSLALKADRTNTSQQIYANGIYANALYYNNGGYASVATELENAKTGSLIKDFNANTLKANVVQYKDDSGSFVDVKTKLNERALVNGDENQDFKAASLSYKETANGLSTNVDVQTAIASKAAVNGDRERDFNANTLRGTSLQYKESEDVDGNVVYNDVKSKIDGLESGKADLAGDIQQAFEADTLLANTLQYRVTTNNVDENGDPITIVDDVNVRSKIEGLESAVATKASANGDIEQNFNADILTANALQYKKVTITTEEVQVDTGEVDENDNPIYTTETVTTETVENKDVQTQIDSLESGKAALNGDLEVNFDANTITANDWRYPVYADVQDEEGNITTETSYVDLKAEIAKGIEGSNTQPYNASEYQIAGNSVIHETDGKVNATFTGDVLIGGVSVKDELDGKALLGGSSTQDFAASAIHAPVLAFDRPAKGPEFVADSAVKMATLKVQQKGHKYYRAVIESYWQQTGDVFPYVELVHFEGDPRFAQPTSGWTLTEIWKAEAGSFVATTANPEGVYSSTDEPDTTYTNLRVQNAFNESGDWANATSADWTQGSSVDITIGETTATFDEYAWSNSNTSTTYKQTDGSNASVHGVWLQLEVDGFSEYTSVALRTREGYGLGKVTVVGSDDGSTWYKLGQLERMPAEGDTLETLRHVDVNLSHWDASELYSTILRADDFHIKDANTTSGYMSLRTILDEQVPSSLVDRVDALETGKADLHGNIDTYFDGSTLTGKSLVYYDETNGIYRDVETEIKNTNTEIDNVNAAKADLNGNATQNFSADGIIANAVNVGGTDVATKFSSLDTAVASKAHSNGDSSVPFSASTLHAKELLLVSDNVDDPVGIYRNRGIFDGFDLRDNGFTKDTNTGGTYEGTIFDVKYFLVGRLGMTKYKNAACYITIHNKRSYHRFFWGGGESGNAPCTLQYLEGEGYGMNLVVASSNNDIEGYDDHDYLFLQLHPGFNLTGTGVIVDVCGVYRTFEFADGNETSGFLAASDVVEIVKARQSILQNEGVTVGNNSYLTWHGGTIRYEAKQDTTKQTIVKAGAFQAKDQGLDLGTDTNEWKALHVESIMLNGSDLSTTLSGKSATSHSHVSADVTDLQDLLDAKANTHHTHLISDVTNLEDSLNGKANTSHTHVIGDVTGLQDAIDARAWKDHGHAISHVGGLQTALDGKADNGHTHSIANVSGLQSALDGKAAKMHTHTMSDITDLSDGFAIKADLTGDRDINFNANTLTATDVRAKHFIISSSDYVNPGGLFRNRAVFQKNDLVAGGFVKDTNSGSVSLSDVKYLLIGKLSGTVTGNIASYITLHSNRFYHKFFWGGGSSSNKPTTLQYLEGEGYGVNLIAASVHHAGQSYHDDDCLFLQLYPGYSLSAYDLIVDVNGIYRAFQFADGNETSGFQAESASTTIVNSRHSTLASEGMTIDNNGVIATAAGASVHYIELQDSKRQVEVDDRAFVYKENALELGSLGRPWSNIYGVDANLTGNLGANSLESNSFTITKADPNDNINIETELNKKALTNGSLLEDFKARTLEVETVTLRSLDADSNVVETDLETRLTGLHNSISTLDTNKAKLTDSTQTITGDTLKANSFYITKAGSPDIDIETELNGKALSGHTHSGYETSILKLETDKAEKVHSHIISDITDLQETLNGKAATGHTHSDYAASISNLESNKADKDHSHAISDVTGLETALNGKALLAGNIGQSFKASTLQAKTITYEDEADVWKNVKIEFDKRTTNDDRKFDITSTTGGWYEIASTIWNASGWFRIWLRDEYSNGAGGHRHSLIALRVHQCYNHNKQTTVIEKLSSAYYEQQDILKARVVQRNYDTNSLAWYTNTHDSYLQIYIRPGILREGNVYQRLYIEQVGYTGFQSRNAKWELKTSLALSATDTTSGFTSVDLDFTDKYGYVINTPLESTALTTQTVTATGEASADSLTITNAATVGSLSASGNVSCVDLAASGDVNCTDVVATSSIQTPLLRTNANTQLEARNFIPGQITTSPNINAIHNYNIAKLPKDPRPVASARFQLVLSSSGVHQSIEFIATVVHDKTSIAVLNNTAYEVNFITELNIIYEEDSGRTGAEDVYGSKYLRIKVDPVEVGATSKWKLSDFYLTLTKFGEGGPQNEWQLLNFEYSPGSYTDRKLCIVELDSEKATLSSLRTGNWSVYNNDIKHTNVGRDGNGGRALVGLDVGGVETLYVNYDRDFDKVVLRNMERPRVLDKTIPLKLSTTSNTKNEINNLNFYKFGFGTLVLPLGENVKISGGYIDGLRLYINLTGDNTMFHRLTSTSNGYVVDPPRHMLLDLFQLTLDVWNGSIYVKVAEYNSGISTIGQYPVKTIPEQTPPLAFTSSSDWTLQQLDTTTQQYLTNPSNEKKFKIFIQTIPMYNDMQAIYTGPTIEVPGPWTDWYWNGLGFESIQAALHLTFLT